MRNQSNNMYNPQVSVFKDLFKTDVPFIVPLKKVFDRIKVGKSQTLITKIREGNKELKKQLPSIVFSGEFSERNANGLKKHSGLMVIDFDNYPDTQTMEQHFNILKSNPHFIGLFVSPSGNGIKGVVRVSDELTKESHPKVFKAFLDAFKYDYVDVSGSDVNRVCFESYDPNIYTNYDATIFNSKIEDEGYEYTSRVPILPIDNEDIIISKIMEWNWAKDFREGERNDFIFNLAGAFCEYGVSQITAEGYILNNVVIGDFPDSEALTAIRSAYKKRSFDIKYFEDYQRIGRIKHDLKNPKKEVIKKHRIQEDTYEAIREEKDADDFWYTTKNGDIKIDPLKYKWFLESQGFKKYFPNDTQKPIWVKIKENIVRETSIEKIKDFVLDYLLEKRGELSVWKKCVNYGNIFSEQYLLMLESIDLVMLRDRKNKSFIAFQNGILEVTKNSIELIDYIDVKGYVWESHIIQRDFTELDNDDNEYKIFINNISHETPLPIETVIGYLLSTYKNKTNNKAIILNDEVISDNPEGGTGKGLFVQGLKQLRRTSVLDGKTFDDKKSFPYQTVSTDTQILVFDDVKKKFDFESKFSLVTEGMTIERKNKDAIKLSVEDSPKMVISTNYAIKGEGNSHDRRRHEIEIAQYYGKKVTPYDEFGHELFDDWDADEFVKFDNYMVSCIQKYLKDGLVHQNAKNLHMRKLIAETSMEFYEWVSDTDNVPVNVRNNKSEMFDAFVSEYQDYKRWLSRKAFNIWLKKYASFIDVEYRDGNSNGVRWFCIGQEKEIEVEF